MSTALENVKRWRTAIWGESLNLRKPIYLPTYRYSEIYGWHWQCHGHHGVHRVVYGMYYKSTGSTSLVLWLQHYKIWTQRKRWWRRQRRGGDTILLWLPHSTLFLTIIAQQFRPPERSMKSRLTEIMVTDCPSDRAERERTSE